MKSIEEAKIIFNDTWSEIKNECMNVYGSELHYQAMIYHCLRNYGNVPKEQIGMNVKMWIDNPVSKVFQDLVRKRHEDYRGGFEPIPDIVLFSPNINSDWRRRSYKNSLNNMFVAIEVKASEREKSRLRPKEIITDIEKLDAHRIEVENRGAAMFPVMLIIDSAPLDKELMTNAGLEESRLKAEELNVALLYISKYREINTLKII